MPQRCSIELSTVPVDCRLVPGRPRASGVHTGVEIRGDVRQAPSASACAHVYVYGRGAAESTKSVAQEYVG